MACARIIRINNEEADDLQVSRCLNLYFYLNHISNPN